MDFTIYFHVPYLAFISVDHMGRIADTKFPPELVFVEQFGVFQGSVASLVGESGKFLWRSTFRQTRGIPIPYVLIDTILVYRGTWKACTLFGKRRKNDNTEVRNSDDTHIEYVMNDFLRKLTGVFQTVNVEAEHSVRKRVFLLRGKDIKHKNIYIVSCNSPHRFAAHLGWSDKTGHPPWRDAGSGAPLGNWE